MLPRRRYLAVDVAHGRQVAPHVVHKVRNVVVGPGVAADLRDALPRDVDRPDAPLELGVRPVVAGVRRDTLDAVAGRGRDHIVYRRNAPLELRSTVVASAFPHAAGVVNGCLAAGLPVAVLHAAKALLGFGSWNVPRGLDESCSLVVAAPET